MRRPVITRARLVKKAQELGSLASATFIVLSVCGVALASMTGASVPLPAPIRTYFEKPMVERTAQAHIASQGVTAPVTCIATVDVHGWRDRGQRVADLTVVSTRPLEMTSAAGRMASVSPEGSIIASLAGRRVLASVSRIAASALPSSGSVSVRLVAVPQGETVGLVVDSVLSGGRAAAVTGASASPQPYRPSPSMPATTASAPHVDRLSAYYGKPGSNVTVFGAGFGADRADGYVVCAGARADVVSWSDTEIVFTVPAEAVRPGYVGIWANGRSSNGIYFVPADRPTVSAISPREGAPGTVVSITGTDFGAEQRGGWVSFAGASGQVVSWSDTHIRVIVPRGVLAGWAGVVANGLSSNGILYGPYGLPFVSSVSTQRLTRGESVTISGRDFGSDPGWVLIDKAKVTPDSWSDSTVTFTVPAGVRPGYLGILRDDLYTSNGWWVDLVPRLKGVSSWWARPGAEVALTGVGFGHSRGDFRITVAGVPVPDAQIRSWTDSTVRFVVPVAARSGYVGVGTAASCSNGIYLVVETPARIDAVSPRPAAPGDILTVTGTGFGAPGGSGRVLIGGGYPCETISWSDTTAVVRVPDGARSGYVGVLKQNVSSNGVWLTVTPE